MIALPAIVGQSVSTAQAALDDDFRLQDPRYEFSADVPADAVIAATGRDGSGAVDLTTVEHYPERGPVTLTVSLGAVPDVTGKTVDDARAALAAVGLELGAQTQQYSEDVPTGQVMSATVTDDPAVKGSAVDVVVSQGPAPIALPRRLRRHRRRGALDARGARPRGHLPRLHEHPLRVLRLGEQAPRALDRPGAGHHRAQGRHRHPGLRPVALGRPDGRANGRPDGREARHRSGVGPPVRQRGASGRPPLVAASISARRTGARGAPRPPGRRARATACG
ncbi:PASTA domain-containing protein [Curtobacterium sp. MCJR17_043]|nr:PASTA domain-containing protein [Curtobacterium sp. MCJR17_043]WIB34738.1 PASTA domain-containing protein [Curtobacterium sp. MCJR17_043]